MIGTPAPALSGILENCNARAKEQTRARGTPSARENRVSDDGEEKAPSSEEKMRRAFEARRGAPFSEEEWEEAKRNLVGLFLMFGTSGSSSEDEPPS